MARQLLIDSEEKPARIAQIMRAFSAQKPSGQFAIKTAKNEYWVKLHYGTILDAAPVIRENGFLRCHLSYLLDAIQKREKWYELYRISS
jgi:hypothetical protein